MKKRYTYLLFSVSLLLIVSCSKKREEAAQLEQELNGQAESTATEMADSTVVEVIDSAMAQVDATAIPKEESKPKAMPARPTGDGYTVQVASCEDEGYARHLVEVYTSRGFEPYVSQISIEGQTYYRVRIGLYENFSEAKALKSKLEDDYSIAVWIDLVSN